jgi:hypothetical protein
MQTSTIRAQITQNLVTKGSTVKELMNICFVVVDDHHRWCVVINLQRRKKRTWS